MGPGALGVAQISEDFSTIAQLTRRIAVAVGAPFLQQERHRPQPAYSPSALVRLDEISAQSNPPPPACGNRQRHAWGAFGAE